MTQTKTFLVLLVLLFCGSQSQAQTKAQTETTETTAADTSMPWYVGIKAGIPFGVSNFSSFAADKTRLGYQFGALAGYTINPIFSAEFSATFGKVGLGAQEPSLNYWLAADGARFLVPLIGEQGHYYRDIYSSVSLQQYGLHLNVSLLPLANKLLNQNINSKFSVMISPAVYAANTRATIKTSADDEQFIKNNSQFNIGVGGDLSVGYQLTECLGLRLSSGVNHLFADQYDGIPNEPSSSNLIVNNSISVTWRLGSAKKAAALESMAALERQLEQERLQEIARLEAIERQKEIEAERQAQLELEAAAAAAAAPKLTAEQMEIERQAKIAESIVFPKLYFAFDVSLKSQTKLNKTIMEIIQILNDNQLIMIRIQGKADKHGTTAVNQRVSFERANTVKKILIENGIAPDRIKTIGMGVDKTTTNENEARRTDILLNVKK